MECCCGFEDMKDEIGSSRKASDIFAENLSNLYNLIVCCSQTPRSAQQTQRFPKHRPVFTVENSADNNSVRTIHSKSVHTRLLQNIRRLLDPLNCVM